MKSIKDGFLTDIVANLHDSTPQLVYADWLDEHGEQALAYAYRWMVAKNVRPVQTKLGSEPLWFWWEDGPILNVYSPTDPGADTLHDVLARIPVIVYDSLPVEKERLPSKAYTTFTDCISALAAALTTLRWVYSLEPGSDPSSRRSNSVEMLGLGATFIVSASAGLVQAAFIRCLAGRAGTGKCSTKYANRSAGFAPKNRSAAVVPSPRLSQKLCTAVSACNFRSGNRCRLWYRNANWPFLPSTAELDRANQPATSRAHRSASAHPPGGSHPAAARAASVQRSANSRNCRRRSAAFP
jgi:uncharacterized protein (TIGR02996 family)